MSIRIILADDHQVMRTGLSAVLAGQPDMEVVAEADEGLTAVQLARELSPDVIVLDITMPGLNGIEAARMIAAESKGVKIIALSMHSDRRFVMEMLKAGASGYLLKDCAVDDLVRAIREIMANHTFLSPEVAGTIVEECVRQSSWEEPSAFSILTDREREVLQLLAEGMNTRTMASRLHVSSKTVETHRQHIAEKLRASSMADLIKYAVREGLTSL